MPEYILTFDLGTTGNKAALIDRGGIVFRAVTAGYGVDYPKPGWASQRAEAFTESCAKACRVLLEGVDPADIACIGLSGTMNGCLPVDESGQPLHPHIIHADTRSAEQARGMEKTGIDWYRLTGNRASPRGSAAKVIWLRDERPQVYRRTRWFLQTKDFVRGWLTGDWGVTDLSDGALTGMMDIKRRRWAGDALRECGIDSDKLPRILRSDTVAGTLTAGAARALGLRAGIPVSVGGGDGACAAAGVGLSEAGQAYCCLGSTAWISVMAGQVLDADARRFVHYFDLSGAHIIPTGTVQSAASAFDWALWALGIGGIAEAARLAAQAPPGAGGVLFAPYLQGERTPWWDDEVRGAFVGLSSGHTRSHMMRAVYEGVACALRSVLGVFAENGARPAALAVLGGGAQSEFWLRVLADIAGICLLPHRDPGVATSLGAALAAGVAVGFWNGWREAARIPARSAPVDPDPARAAAYRPVWEAYDKLYEALRIVTPALSALRRQSGTDGDPAV